MPSIYRSNRIFVLQRSQSSVVSLFATILLAAIFGCGNAVTAKPPKIYRASIVQTFPHDPEAFTQGLVFYNGKLLEGTGQNGRSSLRRVALEDGRVEQIASLDTKYFGEGITVLGKKLYQLTWKEFTCFVYDVDSFQFERSFSYPFEGWGITDNEKELIASDGTSVIRFIDPDSFREKRRIQVTDRDKRIKNINELEWIEGEIWANIWYEDRIARISPENGRVLGWIDLTNVYPMQQRDREAVMNGIAYDADRKRIFITGKNWSKLFEIKISE